MPNGARICLIVSDMPCTYGMDANWGFMVGEVVLGFGGWGFLGWDMRSMDFLGYPFSSNDLTTVCCSFVMDGAVEGMVLALWNRVQTTAVLWAKG